LHRAEDSGEPAGHQLPSDPGDKGLPANPCFDQSFQEFDDYVVFVGFLHPAHQPHHTLRNKDVVDGGGTGG